MGILVTTSLTLLSFMQHCSTVTSLTAVSATRLGHQYGPTGHRSLRLNGDQQMEGGLPAVVDGTPFDRKRGGGREGMLFNGSLNAAARLREPISDTSLPLQSPSPSSQAPLLLVPASCTPAVPLTNN